MARRLKRFVSIVLSAALVVLSVGFDAQQAAAQTISGRAVSVSAAPQIGLGIPGTPAVAPMLSAPALSAPGLLAPSALAAAAPVAAAPVTAAALTAVTPAAAISESVRAAAPALQALAKPETGASAASVAGRDLEDVLTGAASARGAELSEAVVAAPSALTSSLAAPSASPEAPKTPSVPASAPAPFKTISGKASYIVHRLALKTIAVMTGAVFTLPQAGGSLTAKIVASAADKKLVLSDFDDTLAHYNEILPADKIEAVRKIQAAGKHFAVISDRGDIKRPNSSQLTVFESLDSLPVEVRAGMYVAANSGGKVYRYDAQGVPQLVHEATPLEAGKLDAVKGAAEATKARLESIGATQHVDDGKNPSESYNTYGYAMMLKPGSSEDAVRGAAAILSEELASRGIEVEVNPRFAKDPANPPYITFSIITKADAAAYIAKSLKVEAKDALAIGDAMFVPREGKKAGWLSRLGERLSGRPQVKTGNETDRNMAKNLPGLLTLGVGGAMDPRVANGWALDGKGPVVTQAVLESVASKKSTDPRAGAGVETALQLGMIALIVGLGAVGFYAFVSAVGDIFRMGEEAIRNWDGSPFGLEHGFMLGATALGMAGMMGVGPRLLSHPNDSYPQAVKRAIEIARERGVDASEVRFVEATASMPVRDGDQWKYTFAVPGALIYVDFDRFLGGAQDFRSRVYNNAAPSQGLVATAISAESFASLTTLGAEQALLLLRNELPGFGGGASVSLAARPAADGNGAQLSYTFYDDHGSVGTVGTNGGFVRVDAVSAKATKSAAKAAAKAAPAGMTHAVAPNELYALALEKITAKAAAMGVAPERIRLLSAVHQGRSFNGAAIGDEWRFFFGWGGIEYMVPARVTTVSETMMDAFEPETRGALSEERLNAGVPAAKFNEAVLVSPEPALKEVKGVRRVSLLTGKAGLYYSLQDDADELAQVDARTGAIHKLPPVVKTNLWAAFGVWVLGVALVVAIYGGFYWAASHAPVATPDLPEGYNGPIPSMEDIFRGMGGFLGLGMLAGTLKRGAKKAKLAKADIEAAAKSVASSKGGIWSHTEYNMAYYNTLQSLTERGATKAQLALFKKLCDAAPVIGGRFNPWSGD